MGQALHPEISVIALVFVLGLKHGLDPDHLAAIDGFARTTRSRWCGLFFSLGHGLVVTLVGVAIALLAAAWQPPAWLESSGAWISISVLAVLGCANLVAVLRTPPGQPVPLAGMRTNWLSARVAQASHPAIIAAVGAAFAISFDSISTALIFSAVQGTLFAALLGGVFTLGMAVTDQLNGWSIARLVRSADQRAAVASRCMSVAIAGLCFVLALYGLLKYALPQLNAPADAWAPAIGAGTCAFMLLVYLWTARARGSRP
jgi:high-affinity nickel-transport protein